MTGLLVTASMLERHDPGRVAFALACLLVLLVVALGLVAPHGGGGAS